MKTRTDNSVVEFCDVSKHFPGRLFAINRISFTCERPEVLGIIGPNGSGKTTCLRILAGILHPSSGNVYTHGMRVGLVTPTASLFGNLSIYEILELTGRLNRTPELRQEIDSCLERLSLVDYRNCRCSGLSTGIRQRVNLARVLVAKPDVIVLDEPTNGMDIVSRSGFIETVRMLRNMNKKIIYASHHVDEIEILCDRIVVLKEGRVVTVSKVSELRTRMNDGTLTEALLHLF